MNKVLKYSEYSLWEQIAVDFIEQIQNPNLSESENENMFTNICADIFKKWNFNLKLVVTFGTGVKLLYPIVYNLIENLDLKVKPSFEDVVLLCITLLSIMLFEHNKEENERTGNSISPPLSEDDIKNKLNPELQMKFGNPRLIIDKLMSSMRGVFKFINKFQKLFKVSVSNVIDMFAYTSTLLPVMNAIGVFCDKYDLTPENFVGNLFSLGVGIAIISSKSSYKYLIDKFKKTPNSQNGDDNFSDVTDVEDISSKQTKLIKEQ